MGLEAPLSLHAMLWECTLPYGGVSPFVWDPSARRRLARSVPCLLVCLAQRFPSLLVGHAIRWERMLPYKGGDPSPCLFLHSMGLRGLPPPPS